MAGAFSSAFSSAFDIEAAAVAYSGSMDGVGALRAYCVAQGFGPLDLAGAIRVISGTNLDPVGALRSMGATSSELVGCLNELAGTSGLEEDDALAAWVATL